PDFINFLQDIRVGNLTKKDETIITKCEKNNLPDNTTIFFSTNEECDEWNKAKLKKLKGKEYIYEAEIHGKRNKKFAHDKETIARDCIAKQTLKLKVGARVIGVINEKNGKFVNGSTGIVTECVNEKGNRYVEVLFDGNKEPVVIRQHLWIKKNLKGRKVATMKQMPIIPAYALTIHKSQGLTLESAIVDCKNIFVSGQLYVALSRVKTMEGLKIINFHKSQILVNQDVKDFYNGLR
ncbi:MAG: hypothetical protein LBV48_01485, partial [Mycoplasmataceae bacterium]|nr:hypothetical protein [Mycoplasmataceae bacterium]